MPEQSWKLDDLPRRLYTLDEVGQIVAQARGAGGGEKAPDQDEMPWRKVFAELEANGFAEMRDFAAAVVLALIRAQVKPLDPKRLVPLAWQFAEEHEAEAEKRATAENAAEEKP